MKRKDTKELDWFSYSGMEKEIEELEKDISCLIKILEKNSIPVPEHIKKKIKRKSELPFD